MMRETAGRGQGEVEGEREGGGRWLAGNPQEHPRGNLPELSSLGPSSAA